MPVGAGGCPAGACSAGYGVPDAAVVPMLVPYPDPTTGLAQSGPFVNPATGDYLYTTDGRVQGESTVQALVRNALATEFNSSAVVGFGLRLKDIRDRGTNFLAKVRARAQSALAQLVGQGVIQIVSVTVADVVNPDGVFAFVTWRDLTQAANPSAIGAGPAKNEFTTGIGGT